MMTAKWFGISRRLFYVILSAFLLAGCQGIRLDPRSGTVPEEERIRIVTGEDRTGTWAGREIAIDYSYLADGNEMALSGKMNFADLLTYNYSYIEYVYLAVIFADAEGRVLDMTGVTSDRSIYFDPISFNRRIRIPLNAAYFTFTYRGEAYDGGSSGGDSSTTYFWKYPIR